jgi:hypothetical protein
VSDTRIGGGPRRLAAAAVVALAALHGVVAWISREPGVLTGQDDAEYIVLAQSLLDGGYNDLFRVDAPPHRTYPPVYPAALAVWGTIAGRGFDSLVLLNVLASAATLVLLFVVVRRLAGDALALATIALLAINPELIRFAGGIRSEPLFTLLALASLAALLPADGARVNDRPADPDSASASRRTESLWVAIAIMAALASAMTRSIGVTVLAAVGLHWLLQRRWKLVGIPAAIGVAAFGGWLVWTALGNDQFVGSSYIAELRVLWSGTSWTGPLPGRAIEWTRLYLQHGVPAALAFPAIPGTPIDNILLLVLTGLGMLAGLVVLARRWPGAALWIIVYALFLAIWLFHVDRFVVPIAPLLITALLIGAASIGGRIGTRAEQLVPAAAALVLATGAIMGTAGHVRDRIDCDRDGRYPDPSCMSVDQRAYFEALRWIDANTVADAAFLSAKPGALYLYTGRKSIAFEVNLGLQPDQFIDRVRAQGAEWILLDSLLFQEPLRLAPLLAANCRQLRVAASFPPRTWLFRIADRDAAAGTDACAAIDTYLAANEGNSFGAIR